MIIPLTVMIYYTYIESWTLAFQGNVHELSDADADLIEAACRRAADTPGS